MSSSGKVNTLFDDSQFLALLDEAVRLGCDSAEVDVNTESGFSVSVRKGKLDLLEQKNEQSLSLTVFKQQCAATVSTTDFSDHSLQDMLAKVVRLVDFTQPDQYKGLADASCMAYDYPDLKLNYHWGITPEEAISLAIEMDSQANTQDSRILHCESAEVSTSSINCFYANTHGFVGSYSYSLHHVGCGVLVEDSHGKQQYSDYDCLLYTSPSPRD